MGSANEFSRQVSGYVKQQFEARGWDSSRKGAAAVGTFSHTYLADRLRGDYPFNTNDIADIADALGESPFDLVRNARQLSEAGAIVTNITSKPDRAVASEPPRLVRAIGGIEKSRKKPAPSEAEELGAVAKPEDAVIEIDEFDQD